MGSILDGPEHEGPPLGTVESALLPCTSRLAVKGMETLPRSSRVDVSLTLKDLPLAIAEEIEEVQRNQPELMERIVVYGMARSAIFETLLEQLSPAPR